jgi:hypothetical protein
MNKISVLSVVLLFLGGFLALQAKAQHSKQLEKLMVAKLKNSQSLLEGLAMSDFAKISRSAEELVRLSRTAEWFVLKTPRYELHSDEFRRAAETVVRKAKDKNLDGAALAYFDMTMNCLRCHQYMREVREARLEPTSPTREVQLSNNRNSEPLP